MSVDSPLSHVKNTLYAMLVTMLAKGTRDFFVDFPSISKDAAGHRWFQFEGVGVAVANRAVNDLLVTYAPPTPPPTDQAPKGGVNLFFGDPIALRAKDKPQRWFLPLFIHVLMPYTDEHRVGEAQAERLSRAVGNAFEGIGGQQQMYDFYDSPAVPLTGRFVSWAREYRGTWRELGDPTKEAFTNRQWTIQVRYVD